MSASAPYRQMSQTDYRPVGRIAYDDCRGRGGRRGGSAMTRRKRGVWIGAAIVATLLGTEVALQSLKGYTACVQIDNQGADPIEALVVTSGSSRATAGKVAAGGSVRLFLSGRGGPQVLRLAFRQRGNALTGFEMPGFDPALMTAEGSRLVLQVRPNEVVRFQDEGEPTTPVAYYAQGLWRRVWTSLTTPP